MPRTHFTLGSKGGIGKSFIAYLITQHLAKTTGQQPLNFEVDPANETFSAFKALGVHRMDVLMDDKTDPSRYEIAPRRFDALVDAIAKANDRDVVVDTGSSVFVAMCNYLKRYKVFDKLKDELGHPAMVHVPIVAGQDLEATVISLAQLVDKFPASVDFAVWLNPVRGPIQKNDKSFEKFDVYTRRQKRIHALVALPPLDSVQTLDLADLLEKNLTFAEGIKTPDLTYMSKSRIREFHNQVDLTLDAAHLA